MISEQLSGRGVDPGPGVRRMMMLGAAFAVGLVEWFLFGLWERSARTGDAVRCAVSAMLMVLVSTLQMLAVAQSQWHLVGAYIMGVGLGAFLAARPRR